MIFENYEEYKELINEVSSIIRVGSEKTLDKDEEPDDGEDDPVGGEVPLDKVLPPSAGHETGKNPSYYSSPWLEGKLEERLCNLLEELTGGSDQTANSQQAVRQGQVGVVPSLGHGSGKPSSPGQRRRAEVDTMTKVKKAEADADQVKTDKEKSEEMQDEVESLGLDSDETSATPPI